MVFNEKKNKQKRRQQTETEGFGDAEWAESSEQQQQQTRPQRCPQSRPLAACKISVLKKKKGNEEMALITRNAAGKVVT